MGNSNDVVLLYKTYDIVTEDNNSSIKYPGDAGINADINSIARISIVSTILDVVCRTTGMGFAAVARVTDTKWIACSVKDDINFGLKTGGELLLETTICNEIREDRQLVVIDHVDKDERFCKHHTPAMYGFQSYISVPILRKDGSFFGTLCAIDPKPALINTVQIRGMFTLFADLISMHLSSQDELLASEAKILEEQKISDKLQEALQTGNMGTWSIDPKTLHVSMSDNIKELFGFSLTHDISMEQIMEAIDPEYHKPLTDVLTNAVEKHKSSDITYSITNLVTKERKWVRATGKVFLHGNDPVEYSGLVMDVTADKMEEMRKNDFIGMVSHELKTPLTSLNGYIQLLQRVAIKGADTFAASALGKAHAQIKKMSNMINSFLNVSRLEAGKILIQKHEFQLDELLREIIDETDLTVSSHMITFLPCCQVMIYADHDKIGSVISNLLSNAVKYSPKGKQITVKCEIIEDSVVVSVKDEGMGIKPNDINRLFDRFYRVETKHTQNISGFGIGLYLSAEIVERHDGRIWVESQSGVGSTFHFSLPLKAQEIV
ncbi:GAF domain-containing protein [Pedobacter sp. MC2016-14]|uniref:GAF domain-containing sensor histidine kinase n=1 Tax=Pedobacter sp. MC2016-14 TaxID=2897327 RepID=UPI001E429552|nr:GAF domain-containing sensor histidine kinase [Pedobacter sp. MC2016-14]MCD0489094.1 GAF domain-containing protein [Pedobacter sp. MC2016-14]